MMASVTEVALIPVGNICKIVFKFRLLLLNFLCTEFLYCLLKMLNISANNLSDISGCFLELNKYKAVRIKCLA